jgi:hypothetical protein
MDFFVVPTVCFRLLYVWFALEHGPLFNLDDRVFQAREPVLFKKAIGARGVNKLARKLARELLSIE